MKNKLEIGAKTAIKQCIQLETTEKIVIITDKDTLEVGEALKQSAQEITQDILFMVIEDYTNRPATEIPEKMWQEITQFNPDVSIYAAQGQQGELQVFRGPLKDKLMQELGCRHAHMISITKELMEDGLNKDYKEIYKLTKKVQSLVEKAEKIKVIDPHGTAITYEFDKNTIWIPDHGNFFEKNGGNLPAGEVYTCPRNVNGIFVGWLLGDYMSEKYGLLKEPLTVIVENGFVTEVNAKEPIKTEFENYISEYEFGNRVGEIGIGTLLGLTHFTGNLLQDEKYPGVHMALGSSYSEHTKVDWDCPSHIDMIAKDVTITLVENDKETIIMRDGKFTEIVI